VLNPSRVATRLTMHVLAAVAEHEREAVSARTKAALAAVKRKGKVFGNYRRIAEAKHRATAARAEAVRPAITATAHLSTRATADALNRRGVTTASGKQWHAMQVLRARQCLEL
jgi:DNA invertase Pin-like site-specific DNA recombinase